MKVSSGKLAMESYWNPSIRRLPIVIIGYHWWIFWDHRIDSKQNSKASFNEALLVRNSNLRLPSRPKTRQHKPNLKVPTLSPESDIIQLIIKVRFEVEMLRPKFFAGRSEKFRKQRRFINIRWRLDARIGKAFCEDQTVEHSQLWPAICELMNSQGTLIDRKRLLGARTSKNFRPVEESSLFFLVLPCSSISWSTSWRFFLVPVTSGNALN